MRKNLGQNFLTSQSAIKQMVECSNVSKDDTVLEIGPGKGILTKTLLEKAKRVIAIEKDPKLVLHLKEIFKGEIENEELQLLEEDIRGFETKEKDYKVVANIPYYITGIIIKKFLTAENQPKSMALLVQKEVAERILAKDRKESILSLSVKAYGSPKYIKTVKAGSFTPKPKVDSAILLIENISKNFFKNIDEQKFFETIKNTFSQKRKSISRIFSEEDLEKAGVEKKSRPENLKLEDWGKLL